jgi:hypothetical protein
MMSRILSTFLESGLYGNLSPGTIGGDFEARPLPPADIFDESFISAQRILLSEKNGA